MKKTFLLLFLLFSKIAISQQNVGLWAEFPSQITLGTALIFKYKADPSIQVVRVSVGRNGLGNAKMIEGVGSFSFTFQYAGEKALVFVGINAQGDSTHKMIGKIMVLDANTPSTLPNKTTNPPPNKSSLNFLPVPAENETLGKNDNAYNAATGEPKYGEKLVFVGKVREAASKVGRFQDVPASVIVGMAVLESGYGRTRTAYFANNIFGIKRWGTDPDSYQLIGQPDEDEGKVAIQRRTASGGLIFDETRRKDNRYRKFDSWEACTKYFIEELILNKSKTRTRDYTQAVINYRKNQENGMSKKEASQQFAFDLAKLGYNHLGGDYYKAKVSKIMDEWDLYQYD